MVVQNNECFEADIYYHTLEDIKMLEKLSFCLSVLVSVLSQCIFSFTKVSVGDRLALLTWSLFWGLLYQKEQGVE